MAPNDPRIHTERSTISPDRSRRSRTHPPRRWRAPALLVAGALALGATACGSSRTDSASGTTVAAATKVQGLQRTPPLDVSSVTLPEVHAGAPDQPFTTKADPGKLLFVYFGYTHCPDLCPTTMADLRKALKQLGPDASRIQTAFVTVDPQRDTADVLPGYITSFVADAHALRTDDFAALKAAEDKFAASSSLTPNGDGTYEVSHTASSSIVDQNGKIVAEWPFGTSPEVMASDLRLLLAQQRAN